MRPSCWLALAAISFGSIGCGGGEAVESSVGQGDDATAYESVAAEPVFQSSQGEPQQDKSAEVSRVPVQVPEPNATPQAVVHAFLEATRGGDKQVASDLLTRKAVEETTRRGLSVQPPGSASMHYAIGRAEPAPNNKVYVNSVWSEKYEDGTKEEYEVVWILSQESVGWRISGMAAQLDEEEDPLFIDFEFPEELAKRVSGGAAAEGVVGVQPEPRHEQARKDANFNRISPDRTPGANGQPPAGAPASDPTRRF